MAIKFEELRNILHATSVYLSVSRMAITTII